MAFIGSLIQILGPNITDLPANSGQIREGVQVVPFLTLEAVHPDLVTAAAIPHIRRTFQTILLRDAPELIPLALWAAAIGLIIQNKALTALSAVPTLILTGHTLLVVLLPRAKCALKKVFFELFVEEPLRAILTTIPPILYKIQTLAAFRAFSAQRLALLATLASSPLKAVFAVNILRCVDILRSDSTSLHTPSLSLPNQLGISTVAGVALPGVVLAVVAVPWTALAVVGKNTGCERRDLAGQLAVAC